MDEGFGKRVRTLITAGEIDEQLQRWRNAGYSAASVNKFRTALMALWTRLDGRSAANPVKETHLFEEAPITARGQSYDVLERILDAVPTGKARARLELLAWTGMEPLQVKRLTAAHLSIAERWYISPQREKGSKRRRTPRPRSSQADGRGSRARLSALRRRGGLGDLQHDRPAADVESRPGAATDGAPDRAG